MIVVGVVLVVGTSQYIQSANPLSTELPLDSRGRSMITRWRLDEYSSCTRVSAHRYIHRTCINTSPIIILRTCLAAHATVHTYINTYILTYAYRTCVHIHTCIHTYTNMHLRLVGRERHLSGHLTRTGRT